MLLFSLKRFRDFSSYHWIGETPKEMVVDHLFVGDLKDEEDFCQKFKSAQSLRRMKLLYLIRRLHSKFFAVVLYLASLRPSLTS